MAIKRWRKVVTGPLRTQEMCCVDKFSGDLIRVCGACAMMKEIRVTGFERNNGGVLPLRVGGLVR
ncbi:hypothetical protein ACWFRF_05320 [Nocardia sp. NPDC055165]|uniref:hypothetical protein n=1 Tax=Nocardia sp. NPDC060220 TaxID=3347076 RepID=UPI003647183D